MGYRVNSSATDPTDSQLCKQLQGAPLLCGGGCGRPLPEPHIHIQFDGVHYPTGVCSEACAGHAIRRRADREARGLLHDTALAT
jgi:hypothetical protein